MGGTSPYSRYSRFARERANCHLKRGDTAAGDHLLSQAVRQRLDVDFARRGNAESFQQRQDAAKDASQVRIAGKVRSAAKDGIPVHLWSRETRGQVGREQLESHLELDS